MTHTVPIRVFFWFLLMPFAAIASGEELNTRDIIRKAEETASEKVRESWERFQTDIQSPLDQARRELNDAITKLNADKKFNDAQTVQKALADLEKTVMSKTVAIVIQPGPKPPAMKPPAMKPQPVPPQKPLLEKLAGRWSCLSSPQVVKTFDATGRFTELNKGVELKTSQLKILSNHKGNIPLGNWGEYVHVWYHDDDIIIMQYYKTDGSPILSEVLFRLAPRPN